MVRRMTVTLSTATPPPPATRDEAIARRAEGQVGVLTIHQIRDAGGTDALARSRVRSGRWQRLYTGIYAVHSGPITWHARAWAAVLAGGSGAALSHESAAYLDRLALRPPEVIDVLLPPSAGVPRMRGVVFHRSKTYFRGMESPPRTSRVRTLSDRLDRAETQDEVVALLAAAVRRGLERQAMLRMLASFPRLRHRRFISGVLGDVFEGDESPLELRFHRAVERAHGLPRGQRQTRERRPGGWIRSDVRYVEFGLRTELDGELAHPGGASAADVWRDNETVIATGEVTLRYRWAHVVGQPCETAGQLIRALRRGGWRGEPRPCGPGCRLLRALVSPD